MRFLLDWFRQRRARRQTHERIVRMHAASGIAPEKLIAAATAEPRPDAIHVALLRKNFPQQWFSENWVPDLHDLANLAVLRRHFSEQRPAPLRNNSSQFASGIEELTRHFRR